MSKLTGKCKVCGRPSDATLYVPERWRKIDPSLSSHEELCFNCGMDAEVDRIPLVLINRLERNGQTVCTSCHDIVSLNKVDQMGRCMKCSPTKRPQPAYKAAAKRRLASAYEKPIKNPHEDIPSIILSWNVDRILTRRENYLPYADHIGSAFALSDLVRFLDSTTIYHGTRQMTITPSVFRDLKRTGMYTIVEATAKSSAHKFEGGHKMAKEDETKAEGLSASMMKTLIQTVMSSATNLALRMKTVETPREKGEVIANVKILNDALEVLTKAWRAEIAQCPGFYEMYPELDKKVVLQEGKALTEIDNNVLDVLTIGEIKKIVKVTEKGLKEVGHEDLIPQYKITTGKGDPTVQVRDLSQDDLKHLAENTSK